MKGLPAALIALFMICASTWADACSLAIQLEEDPDRLVILAEITGYVSETHDGTRMFGVELTPRVGFQTHGYLGNTSIRLFPQGLGPACNHIPTTQREYIEEGYPVGRLIALYGVVPTQDPMPSLRMMGSIDFDLLAEECTLERTTLARPRYDQFEEHCGSPYFHAYKEIAGLEDASADERLDVLSRLAEFPGFFDFRNLVERHEPDTEMARQHIESRYADVTAAGCDNQPPPAYEIESSTHDAGHDPWTYRMRWFEYCGER